MMYFRAFLVALIFTIGLFLISCSSTTHRSPAFKPETNALDKVYSSVFQIRLAIESKDAALGSAVAVAENKLLTAAHVCTAAMEVTYFYKDQVKLIAQDVRGQRYDVRKEMEIFPDRDLCLITVPGISKYRKASLANRGLLVRDRVHIIGGPLGMFPIETEGRFMAHPFTHSEDPSVASLDLLSCPAAGGNSGGPVFNSKGELVGILVMGLGRYSQVTFSVNLEDIRAFLARTL